MNSTITASPPTATGRWMKRRTASCIGLRGIAAPRAIAEAATVVLTAKPGPACSCPPQPRIGHHVKHIRQQIEHDIKKRRDQHHALHHRVVAVEYRIDDHLAEPRY